MRRGEAPGVFLSSLLQDFLPVGSLQTPRMNRGWVALVDSLSDWQTPPWVTPGWVAG